MMFFLVIYWHFIVGLFLRKSSAAVLNNENSAHLLDGSCHTSKVFVEADGGGNGFPICPFCLCIS